MRIIDFENHFCTQAWVDAVSAKKEGYPRLMNAPDGMLRMYYTADVWVPFQAAKLGDLGAQRIELMDQAGVDVAVLSLATPGTDPFEPSLGTQIAKKTNDFLAEAIGKYPDRYMGYACLAPKDIDSAVNELERCVKEFGFVGWNAHSNFGDSYLDEKRYWPLLAKAEELGVPIFIHPAVSIIPQFRTYGMGLAGPTFGFGAETAMVMMRLIVSGALDAFPKLTIILGHYGEGLPFMFDRVNRDYVQGHVRPESSVGPPLKRLRLLPAFAAPHLPARIVPGNGLREQGGSSRTRRRRRPHHGRRGRGFQPGRDPVRLRRPPLVRRWPRDRRPLGRGNPRRSHRRGKALLGRLASSGRRDGPGRQDALK